MHFEFHPITLKDRAAVEDIRRRSGNFLAAYTYTSLYLWKDDCRFTICVEQDAFMVRFEARGKNAFQFPCGSPEKQREFVAWVKTLPDASLHYLRQPEVEFLESEFPGEFICEEVRGDFEYLYDRDEQIKLQGGDFKRLRSRIRRAAEASVWKVELLDESNISRAEKVVRRWEAEHGRMKGKADSRPTLEAFRHFSELELHGIILSEGGNDRAAAFGTMVSEEIFDLNFSKTLVPNIDEYLHWELYKTLPETVRIINQEDDVDSPGIRRHKLNAKPSELVKLWSARRNDGY